MGISAYEREREINIAKNKAILEALGLDKPAFDIKEKPKPVPRKRKIFLPSPADENDTQTPIKKTKLSAGSPQENIDGLRRSARNGDRKPINYRSDNFESKSLPGLFLKSRDSSHKGDDVESNDLGKLARSENSGNCLGKRTHNPKVFGHIPGIEVGTWWETRAHCSTDAVHAPFVAGISGDTTKGAYSVALSGGYDDDVDLGYAFTFTGSGGRDLKGTAQKPKNLRTAPQSSDQTFENSFNKSLQVSSKSGKPVRVIRGYKLQSKYAPVEGYRYDGLYRVEKAWMERGLNPGGYLVCKFALKVTPPFATAAQHLLKLIQRLGGQPPLPERDLEETSNDKSET